ncbi:myelin protein zero-like protein 2 isoform X2 [Acanthopagrus latus]|uniref:myelin protein zero-like protein 2 isoform X2 n=1 Tax=Acanthopagrus latus TaxID=8177 RepID=UPI00187BFFB7|nr:myelin protein zero-like protein 2 isoform X2 [Acanthopagrus latus]
MSGSTHLSARFSSHLCVGGGVSARFELTPGLFRSSDKPAVHPMCVKGLRFLTVLCGLAASGMLQVSGMRIYTHGNVEAVNGTDVRLKCTFESSAPINPSSVVISWSFRPLKPGREESVFHYQQKPYPPVDGIFRKRVSWAGDIMGRDASIILQQVKFTYNGTYICQVKNPPDVHGAVGEIRLRVVTTASFSELLYLAFAVLGGILIVVFLLVVIWSCRRCKRRRQGQLEENVEAPRKERKDPTACHPSRAVHLYLSETSIEIDSSDGMISEASTKDPSSSEDEGPSSDDDDGGDDSD